MRRVAAAGSLAGGVLLALALFRGVASNPSPRRESANTQKRQANAGAASRNSKTSKKKWPADGPWQASREYFAGLPSQQSCLPLDGEPDTRKLGSLSGVTLSLEHNRAENNEVRNQRSTVWCVPQEIQVRAMVAIVPDPVHSHLSLVFDRSLESLQLAAEQMNYVVDRYWLPWQPDLGGEYAAAAESQDGGTREKEPGLLLFRWNGPAESPAPKVLYVFLVADTSTAGINGQQFRNAVEYVQQVCGNAGKPAPGCGAGRRIWIMGPSFSGSLSSLRRLTDSMPGTSFAALSGTISSICAVQDQGLLPQDVPVNDSSRECVKHVALPSKAASPPHAPNLTFRSMVADSETVVRRFIAELQSHHAISCSFREVAIFSEAATTYGEKTSSAAPQASLESDSNGASGNNCYTSFRYPREISSLRNAAASREAPSPSTQPSAPGSTYLPFTLADRQPNASDEPPDFSRAQGPLSKEAVLMKYAAELRRGHYKYAGIIGTNVVDVIFLAKFLRSACPDIRLFSFNSDLLFERDVDNAPYIGMLSLSTYPLFSRDLDWTGSGYDQRLPFADQYEEGQYNAALLVIRGATASREDVPLRELKQPFASADKLLDADFNLLPVWVTVAGTGGYWPVQLLPAATTARPHREDGKLDTQDFSPSWKTLVLLLAGLTFLQAWIISTANPGSEILRDFSLINTAPPQRFFFINVASVCLGFTLWAFITPALKFGMSSGRVYVPCMAILGVFAVLALMVSCIRIFSFLQQLRGTDKRDGSRPAYVLSMSATAACWVFAGVGGFLWWRLHGDDPSGYGFFFAYRAVNLATGVSPLTPMLLLVSAIFLWSIFEIWRLRFDDQVRPRLNVAQRLPGHGTEKLIADAVNKYFLGGNYTVTFLIVFGAWLFSLQPAHPFELFEKGTFAVLYGVLFALVVALMLTSGLRLAKTWFCLRALLRELERSRIRVAFSRLKEGSWSPIWQSGGQETEWTGMVRSFEVLEQISSCDQPLDAELAEPIKKALEKRAEIRDVLDMGPHGIAGWRRVEQLLTELQERLADALNHVMLFLRQYWGSHCLPVDNGRDSGSDKAVVVYCCKEEPEPEIGKLHRLEEFAALRYVAFIRAVLGHVRHWLILQAAVFSLVLLSLNVYSFEPHQSLIWSFTAIFVFIGVIAIQVLIQAHRNHVISRITGTQPNKLELNFFIRIATLGAVPLLTLLATHFPSLGRYLLSWLQPGVEAFK